MHTVYVTEACHRALGKDRIGLFLLCSLYSSRSWLREVIWPRLPEAAVELENRRAAPGARWGMFENHNWRQVWTGPQARAAARPASPVFSHPCLAVSRGL